MSSVGDSGGGSVGNVGPSVGSPAPGVAVGAPDDPHLTGARGRIDDILKALQYARGQVNDANWATVAPLLDDIDEVAEKIADALAAHA